MVTFAERLKELRTDKGLTMKQVADAINVSEIAISRWERELRVPSINNAKELALFFGVTVGYLVGTEN